AILTVASFELAERSGRIGLGRARRSAYGRDRAVESSRQPREGEGRKKGHWNLRRQAPGERGDQPVRGDQLAAGQRFEGLLGEIDGELERQEDWQQAPYRDGETVFPAQRAFEGQPAEGEDEERAECGSAKACSDHAH